LSGVVASIALLASATLAFGRGAFMAFVASTLWVALASATMVLRPASDVQPLATRETIPTAG